MFFCPPKPDTVWLSRVWTWNDLICKNTDQYELVIILTKLNITGGVSRVDDAQGSGAAVSPGLIQGALQLADVQTPALFFIQVIVDLHGTQFGQCSRVQRVLRYGDHDACASRTLATHKQL